MLVPYCLRQLTQLGKWVPTLPWKSANLPSAT